MDAIDILGSLLGGRKSGGGSSGGGGGGLGGVILGQILKNATAGARQPEPQQHPSPPASSGRGSSRVPGDLQQEASELEDLLNVARNRNEQRTQAPPAPASRPTPQAAPQQNFPHSNSTSSNSPFSNSPFAKPTSRTNAPPPRRDSANNPQQQNEDAIVLIRAMINAAKSDGEISEAEQQSILERIGNPTQEVIEFLRNEFNQPLDVREFAWSVPLGLEQKVYTMSLAAIDLDQSKEAGYLRDLAHGLRLSPEVCNQIHQQFGAQEIF
ncbi:MAG: DUF533 domain-containing protein [Pirellulaceae bacterium]|nr:DUF533 domain-containing protein [Pirellulaceae bacterium]